ncbi:MAG: endolytic transglycosylase MltG [Caldilineaceae bacterium]
MMQLYLDNNRAMLDVPLDPNGEMVDFDVAPGSTARAIAQKLQTDGIIGDAQLFEAYVRSNGVAQQLEAGSFRLSPSMTIVEIADVLQDARAQSIRITIPEGWRLEQTADYLSDAEMVDGVAYRQLAMAGDFDLNIYPFLATRPAGTSLEGYLFPNTYELPAQDPRASDLIRRQLDTFAAQVMPVYEEAVAAAATELDLYAVLVIASIVEREAVVAEERPAIAAVYLNRIAQGMRLEADPTVQYAMGYQEAADQWWKTPVTLDEYSGVNSPYNTYLYAGIPPGPIAAPGLDSIRAVLYPDEHNYLYFVATPDGSGAHVFAETWEEHLVNVQRYQQGQ